MSGAPVGWFCQMDLKSPPGNGSRMIYPLMEPLCQDPFDAVNADGNVSWRQAGDLSGGLRVQVLQVADDDLAIERFQSLDQRGEPLQIDPLIGRCRTFVLRGKGL